MPRNYVFRLIGADHETGAAVDTLVEAANQAAARDQAVKRGVRVVDIRPTHQTDSDPEPSGATIPLVIAGCLCVLIGMFVAGVASGAGAGAWGVAASVFFSAASLTHTIHWAVMRLRQQ